jgi:hypothetical protein
MESADVESRDDLLKGALLPGEEVLFMVPVGTYRLVAETGAGTEFRSPLLHVGSEAVARWSVHLDGGH